MAYNQYIILPFQFLQKIPFPYFHAHDLIPW